MTEQQQFYIPSSILLLLAVGTLYRCGLWIYRIFFHPLAEFPGPLSARGSKFFYFRWNVLNQGQLIHRMPKLFEKHGMGAHMREGISIDEEANIMTTGPIVRLGPNALAIRDINHYHQVFKMGTKFFKDPTSYSQPVLIGSLITLTDPREARARREATAPFFSRNSVKNLEPLIHDKLRLFMKRLETCTTARSPMDASRGFRALTADIIMEYGALGFPRSLELPSFQPMFLRSFEKASKMVHFNKLFPSFLPTLLKIAEYVPDDILKVMLPRLHDVKRWRQKGRNEVVMMKTNPYFQDPSFRNVFQNLLNDDPKTGRKALPDKVIAAEAVLLVTAGTDTTGHALTVATYNLLRNPAAEARLLAELRTVMPTGHEECSLTDLENMVYLNAVLKESLRHSYGVPGFLPRIVPPCGTYVNGQFIPGGTSILHSHYIYHTDPVIFGPDPHAWRPERWLEASKPKLAQMEKHFMPFSRGSRICIGMNLGWTELHIVLSTVIRRFKMELFETDDQDMEWTDCFVPSTKGILRLTASKRVD